MRTAEGRPRPRPSTRPADRSGDMVAVGDDWSHQGGVCLCHLANIAMRRVRPLAWDPTRELVPGDDEANVLVRRPRREGYRIDVPV